MQHLMVKGPIRLWEIPSVSWTNDDRETKLFPKDSIFQNVAHGANMDIFNQEDSLENK